MKGWGWERAAGVVGRRLEAILLTARTGGSGGDVIWRRLLAELETGFRRFCRVGIVIFWFGQTSSSLGEWCSSSGRKAVLETVRRRHSETVFADPTLGGLR